MKGRGRLRLTSPAVLAGVAILLLVAGLWGPVSRAWDTHRAAESQAARQEAMRSERAAIEAELAADKPGIVARIRVLQDREDHAAALALAGRYRLVDREIEGIYRRSALAQGTRMRLASDRDLIGKLCTAADVQDFVDAVFTIDAPGGVRSVTSGITADRATSGPDYDLVRQRITSVAPGLDVSEQDPDSPRGEAHDHRNQLHPYTAAALLDPAVDAGPLICLWNVTGTRRMPGGNVPFSMKLWLAPRPGSNILSAEPLAYTEGVALAK